LALSSQWEAHPKESWSSLDMCDPLDAAELGCCSVPYRGAEMEPSEEDYAAQQQLGGEGA
jgi:hypothetical protein